MSRIRISRQIDIAMLRTICLRFNLYTKGKPGEYDQMLLKAEEAATDEDFIQIAENIWRHTDIYVVGRGYGDFSFNRLLWYIFNDCVRTYVSAIDITMEK